MECDKGILCEVLPVRKELFWDTGGKAVSPEQEIEKAINFGGFDFVEEVQKKYGMERFVKVLMTNRSLSKRAVNYWCLVLGIDRDKTAVFKKPFTIWSPLK